MFEPYLGLDSAGSHVIDDRKVLPIVYPPKAHIQHPSFDPVNGTR